MSYPWIGGQREQRSGCAIPARPPVQADRRAIFCWQLWNGHGSLPRAWNVSPQRLTPKLDDAESRRRLAVEFLRQLKADLHLGTLAPQRTHSKGIDQRDLVTDRDVQLERRIAEGLLRRFPDDGILGEEGARCDSRSGTTWVIDPIDGTTNFVAGSPFWAISIAAVHGTNAIASVVVAPVLGLEFSASTAQGAFMGEERLTAQRGAPSLDRALVATGFAPSLSTRERQLRTFGKLAEAALDVRIHGAASLELCLVASGRQDAFVEEGLAYWDVVAGALIATQAGASVAGQPLDTRMPLLIAAGSAELAHDIECLLVPSTNGGWASHTDSAREQIAQRAADGGRRVAKSAGIVTVAGEGSYLLDAAGHRYLDFVTGFGVASLGHSYGPWTHSISEQARKLVTTTFYEPTQAAFLTALAGVMPAALDRIGLYSGGAEAVEVAVRLCQQATGRSGLLTLEDSFHGKTLGVRHSAGGPIDPGSPIPSWLGVIPEKDKRSPEAFRHLVSAGDHRSDRGLRPADLGVAGAIDDVGTVLVEPIMGTAGNRPLPQEVLVALRRMCDEQGWLLIFDESITGFGRTGAMFASDLYGVVPDVLVAGKGMGGGVPLSCVAASKDLWQAASLSQPSAASTSFGGNALACAGGLAVLNALSQGAILENVDLVGKHLHEGLSALEGLDAVHASTRGVGLMLGFDWVTSSGAFADSAACHARFQELLHRGVLVAADVPRVRLSPPLNLSVDEADSFLDALSSVKQ